MPYFKYSTDQFTRDFWRQLGGGGHTSSVQAPPHYSLVDGADTPERGGAGGGGGGLLALALATTLALHGALALQPCGGGDSAPALALTVVTAERAGGGEARALRGLLAAALQARGLSVRHVAPPPQCAHGAGATPECASAVLRALAAGRTAAALLALGAASPPHVLALRDAALEELGDAAPPARLMCAARAPAVSLTDFEDEALAAQYGLPADLLQCPSSNESEYQWRPEWCAAVQCGALLTSSESEARELGALVRRHRLWLSVRAMGACAPRIAPPLVCTRDRALPAWGLHALAVPPCAAEPCAFDPVRLVKVVNARMLAHSPSAAAVLGRVALTDTELGALRSGAISAAAVADEHRTQWAGAAEARVAVMVPARSLRHAFDGAALRAAAALAEEDAPRDESADFKVEVLDDGCAATRAFKYLVDAPGAEWGALSAVAGPACGVAFADVARQSAALRLPALAYTPQAPAPGAPLTLLAAGDARQYALTWAALAARLRWRRVSVLSELATRAALPLAALGMDVLLHVELPAEGDDLDLHLINQWARRSAELSARVLLVGAEDARAVRAALCAGLARGLQAHAGAVWLLPATLPADWLRPRPADTHGCSEAELRAAAEGHLSVAPAWFARWDAGATPARRAWSARWTARCDECGDAPAHAAALYDALRLWLGALGRLLRAQPAALDDLHCNGTVWALVRDATTAGYTGLTGAFRWLPAGDGLARADTLVLQQWLDGAQRAAAEWREGAGLSAPRLRWLTADGAAPDDGAERCSLQPLAELLHSECRTAFVALGSTLLVLVACALGGAAYRYKRRAERDYRRRLAALGLRDPAPKPGGLDRWEVSRERVVINRKLGTGAFGTVYGGHALVGEGRGWVAVAVKTLKAGASTEEKLDFLSEAEAMKRLEHKNVVRLLGVVTRTEPVCTVMEFMLYGDLKNYLLARRHLAAGAAPGAPAGDERGEVSAPRLTRLALDAARALSYLAQQRYVHRDVAARNCLVSAARVLKLADFGMARRLSDSDYYRFSRRGLLPVRWMAPESLALGLFSPASDVWAYGVLLYEIVTFGALPFQGLANSEVLARVKAGHTLHLPPGINPQLAGLMKLCWSREQRARPGAAELAAFLAEWPRLLSPCLDVPLDALALDPERDAPPPWRAPRVAWAPRRSWEAPASAATDTTELSEAPPPAETDSFLA